MLHPEPGGDMRRREFIGVIGGAAAVWPLAVRAQQSERIRRIGVLSSFAETDQDAQARLTALREGLQALGWTAGRNLQFDIRWFVNDMDLLRRSAQELIALGPDLIVTSSTVSSQMMRQASASDPDRVRRYRRSGWWPRGRQHGKARRQRHGLYRL